MDEQVFYRLVCSAVVPGHAHSFGCFRPVERGRLVDREAIDYEAATVLLGCHGDCSCDEPAVVEAAVDAAIGGTDDPR